MTDRGEYRAIRRVLLDGPDFQRLPERARFVFLALKLNLGPSGIEVWYPAELQARLSAQTGAAPESVAESLDALERAGWIQREGNIVWIVGQLQNDPHVKVTDPKHRKMIQRHVDGLPRLNIVVRFVLAHEGWFTERGAPSEALARAIEGPSEGHRSTENKPEPENKPEFTAIAVSPSGVTENPDPLPKPVCDAAYERWLKIGGSVNYGRFRKALLPVYEARFSDPPTQDELLGAIDAFGEARAAEKVNFRAKYTINYFAETLRDWVRLGAMPLVDDWGNPTERGMAAGVAA